MWWRVILILKETDADSDVGRMLVFWWTSDFCWVIRDLLARYRFANCHVGALRKLEHSARVEELCFGRSDDMVRWLLDSGVLTFTPQLIGWTVLHSTIDRQDHFSFTWLWTDDVCFSIGLRTMSHQIFLNNLENIFVSSMWFWKQVRKFGLPKCRLRWINKALDK